MYQNKIGANRIQKDVYTSTFSNDPEAPLNDQRRHTGRAQGGGKAM